MTTTTGNRLNQALHVHAFQFPLTQETSLLAFWRSKKLVSVDEAVDNLYMLRLRFVEHGLRFDTSVDYSHE